ncbi:hypothetical protein N7492_002833 [Penicillium capsulatum]|uniref:Mitochondrial import inner membrane translocase subunit n=1 Tax=Penicillium capsulatum TaxID=69766 RepID=A0A9W9II99_9EURO|nr:hypothetical protein N7492_002833 [Penicillium capsulatum]KAJ6122570.1 hypothetical protein N7512_005035 [Penicillium capsulatum]
MDPQTQLDLSKLNDSDKKELNTILAGEAQKATLQQTVHSLNDTCWKKCITSNISSGSLSKSEETCAQNCVDRWMDTQMSILKQLETMRG